MRLPTRSSLAVSAAQQRIKTNEKKIAEWRAEKDRLEREKKAKQKQGGILPLLGTVAGAGLGLAAGGPAGAIAGAKAGAGIGGFIEKPTVASGVGAAEGLSYFTDEAVAARKRKAEIGELDYEGKQLGVKKLRKDLLPVKPSAKDVAQTGLYEAQADKTRSEIGKVAEEKIDKTAVSRFNLDLQTMSPEQVSKILQGGKIVTSAKHTDLNDMTKWELIKAAESYLRKFNRFEETNYGKSYDDYLEYLQTQQIKPEKKGFLSKLW